RCNMVHPQQDNENRSSKTEQQQGRNKRTSKAPPVTPARACKIYHGLMGTTYQQGRVALKVGEESHPEPRGVFTELRGTRPGLCVAVQRGLAQLRQHRTC